MQVRQKKLKIPEYWLYWTYQSSYLLKQPLYTANGKPLKIIHPGRQNHDNGPDFQQAILEIDNVRLQGDVEFHLTPGAWFQHGHHLDKRYQNVRLHVVWDVSATVPEVLQQRFPHLVLRHSLRIPEAQWQKTMLHFEGHLPPEPFLNSNSTPFATKNQLAQLAEKRLRRKTAQLANWHQQFSFEDTLFIALAETLGYAKNKFAFRQLLWTLPPSRFLAHIPPEICSPFSIWVYLASRASLLPNPQTHSSSPARNQMIQQALCYAQYFRENGFLPVLNRNDWNFSRIRPANQAYLRLAALSQWIYHYRSGSLFRDLLNIAMQRRSLQVTLKKWSACLQHPLQKELAILLRTLFRLKQTPQQTIGITRLRQFIINALLPLLIFWAIRSNNPGFRMYLEGLYEQFPATETAEKLQKYMAVLLRQPHLSPQISQSAFFQQGILELLCPD